MISGQDLSWRLAPFLRLLPPFLLGIVAAWYLPWPATTGYLPGFLALLLLLGGYYLSQAINLSRRNFMGCAILSWFLLLGFWRGQTAQEIISTTHFSKLPEFSSDSSYYWSADIQSIRPGAERLRLVVDLHRQASEPTAVYTVNGHLLLYLAADSNSQQLLPGQRINFRAKASPIQQPKNPDAFDFADWQAKRNVFHQSWIEKEDWLLADAQPSLLGLAMQVRQQLLKVLYTYLPSGSNELAVAAALILGKRDELSNDLRNAYAETGAIHVLAVSGLHLGLIAGGLAWLLSFGFLGKRSWRWLKFGLVLAGIWCFAFITGLSPSVMRAAVMFSFVELGRTLGERSNTYNILAASALLLLLINPLLLFDVGFQLSYLAVVGILFFQARIYRLWYTPYRIIDGVWKLSTVAIAAQLTTFPLSLYYFHQFPLYFLLSGLVVVITASIILYLGIGLFVLHYLLPFLAKPLALLLYGALYINNAVVYYVRSLPGHLLEGVWIDEVIAGCLYLMLVSFMVYLLTKKNIYLLSSLVFLCGGLAINVWQQYTLSQQRRLIVYHQYKSNLIDMFDGRLKYTIGAILDDDPNLDWDVNPHRQRSGIRASCTAAKTSLHWHQTGNVYGFYDKRLVCVNASLLQQELPLQPFKADVVVVSDSPYLSLAEMTKHYEAAIWVFDGSNYPKRVRKWLVEAEELDLSTHWTAEQGYFELDF
ncbi:MAG: ComEC/Rec2 family competence protein [Bacteroidota bacterium]